MDLSFSNFKKKFFGVWQSSEEVSQRVVRGSILIFSERVLIKILYFGRTVILARLLFPGDFGLYGLAVLSMNVVDVFLQPALGSALIQKKEIDRKHLDTTWSFGILRNIFVALVLFFLAPLAGPFFHNGAVIPFARALGIMIVVSGFENIGVVFFNKELQFNRQFFYDMSAILVEVAVVIVGAFILRNAWALVIGAIANRLTYTVISYFVHPYRPRFRLHIAEAKELFRFGKWVGFSGLIIFFVSQGDNLMVGKLLDVTSLGFYQLAFALGTLPAVEIASALRSILFPVYAKLQDNRELLSDAFTRTLRMVFAIVIPASFGLSVLANEIVRFVYGHRWLPMVPVLYVIVIYGLFRALDSIINPLFMGIGKLKMPTFILILQFLIMFSLIVPLTDKFGIVGTGLSVFAGLFVAEAILLATLNREINLKLLSILKTVGLSVLGGLIMSSLIFFVKRIIPASNLPVFILYILGGVIVYFTALFYLDRIFGRKFFGDLLWIKKNI